MRKINLKKYYSLFLILIFFITSCSFPINEVNNTSIKSKIDVIYYLKNKVNEFNTKSEGGIACNTRGSVQIVGNIPQGCNVTIDFKVNGSSIKSLNNPSEGFHHVMWPCSCGVTRNIEIIGTKTGSCGSFQLPSNESGSYSLPCPNEDRPEEDDYDEDCSENADILLPSTLKDLSNTSQGFTTQSFQATDIHESISDLINLQVKLRSLQDKYSNLNSRGFTTEATTINSQITSITAERDDLKNGLISKISTRKSNLRTKVNNILNQTNSDIFTDPITTLEDYDRKIYDTGANLEHSANSQVTISTIDFVDAYRFLADEYELLAKLINDVVNGSFSASQEQIETLLKNLSVQNIKHTLDLKSGIEKFEYDTKIQTKKLYDSLLKAQDFLELSILGAMVETGVINYTTGAINSGFSISGFIPPNTGKTLSQLKTNVVNSHGSVTSLMSKISDAGFEKVAEYFEDTKWATYDSQTKSSIVQNYKEIARKIDFPNSPEEVLYGSYSGFQIQASRPKPNLSKSKQIKNEMEKRNKSKKLKNEYDDIDTEIDISDLQDNIRELVEKYLCKNKTPREELLIAMEQASPPIGDDLGHVQFDWLHPTKKDWYPPKGWELHHIVDECNLAPGALKSRILLKLFDVGIETNSDNLMFLPGSQTGDKAPIKLSEQAIDPVEGWDNAKKHTRFSDKYSDDVYKRIYDEVKGFNPNTQKAEGAQAIKKELHSIQRDLRDGKQIWPKI